MADEAKPPTIPKQPPVKSQTPKPPKSQQADKRENEVGGPKGPEPTRYGDWEKGGRCFDF